MMYFFRLGSLTTSDLPTKELTERNQRKMKAKFFGLVAHISTTLGRKMSMELDEESGEETFQQFREYVAGVCNDSSIECKRTVREIFGAIRDGKCWDLNGDPYHLLLQVMEGVEDAVLMASVERAHENYYTQYLVAAKVVDHMFEHKADKPVDYRPNFTKLSIKLDEININACSVSYLIDLWEAVKGCVRLPDLFSVLAAIEEGSLIVTWLVPVYAIPALMRLPRSSPDLFSKFPIIRMTINGVCFFEVNIREGCAQLTFSNQGHFSLTFMSHVTSANVLLSPLGGVFLLLLDVAPMMASITDTLVR